MSLNIQDSNTLFAGGYYEEGDPTRLKLSFLRQTQREARNDACSSAEPPEHLVVVEFEVFSVDKVVPGSIRPAVKTEPKDPTYS